MEEDFSDAPSLRESERFENPRFADARAAGRPWWEIAAMGGCPACWGKGKWFGITDAHWKAFGPRAPGTLMSCPYCRGTGLDHASPSNRKDGSSPINPPTSEASRP